MKLKEPLNTWTHFLGFLAGIAGLVMLLIKSEEDPAKLITMSIFGLSILFLYGASAMYHGLHTTPQRELLLRKIDHIAIFLLITGTYTPLLFYGLHGWWRGSMLVAVWSIALIGILLKIFFMKTPRLFSTLFYLALGWMAVIPLAKLMQNLPPGALVWLLIGGLSYTVGAVIYGTKKVSLFNKRLGFHEIFHIFILLGTVSHFIMVYHYLIPR